MSYTGRLKKISSILAVHQEEWTRLLREQMDDLVLLFIGFSQECENWDRNSTSPTEEDREKFSIALVTSCEFLKMLTPKDLKILVLTPEERDTILKEFTRLANELKTGKF